MSVPASTALLACALIFINLVRVSTGQDHLLKVRAFSARKNPKMTWDMMLEDMTHLISGSDLTLLQWHTFQPPETHNDPLLERLDQDSGGAYTSAYSQKMATNGSWQAFYWRKGKFTNVEIVPQMSKFSKHDINPLVLKVYVEELQDRPIIFAGVYLPQWSRNIIPIFTDAILRVIGEKAGSPVAVLGKFPKSFIHEPTFKGKFHGLSMDYMIHPNHKAAASALLFHDMTRRVADITWPNLNKDGLMHTTIYPMFFDLDIRRLAHERAGASRVIPHTYGPANPFLSAGAGNPPFPDVRQHSNVGTTVLPDRMRRGPAQLERRESRGRVWPTTSYSRAEYGRQPVSWFAGPPLMIPSTTSKQKTHEHVTTARLQPVCGTGSQEHTSGYGVSAGSSYAASGTSTAGRLPSAPSTHQRPRSPSPHRPAGGYGVPTGHMEPHGGQAGTSQLSHSIDRILKVEQGYQSTYHQPPIRPPSAASSSDSEIDPVSMEPTPFPASERLRSPAAPVGSTSWPKAEQRHNIPDEWNPQRASTSSALLQQTHSAASRSGWTPPPAHQRRTATPWQGQPLPSPPLAHQGPSGRQHQQEGRLQRYPSVERQRLHQRHEGEYH